MYVGEGQHSGNRWSVLVQIDVDTQLKSTVFARIDQLSFMRDEHEILFSISAVFKIMNVYQDTDNNRWLIHLRATDEGRENLKEYGNLLRNDSEETNIHVAFGRLIMNTGKYAEACRYFTKLVSRLPSEDVDVQVAIQENHGRALFFLGKYQASLAILSEGLASYKRATLSFESSVSLRLEFNIANVYMFTGRFNEALELYEKVVNSQQKILQFDHRHIAESFCGISWAYQKKPNYRLALDYCERGLNILQRTLPPNHPSIYKALASLAGILEMCGQWNAAFDELHRALDTCRRFLPNNHPHISELLRYIGGVHINKGEFDIAFDYYQRVLAIRQHNFPECHVSTANIMTNIADIHRRRKEYDIAIDFHIRSDEMRTQIWPLDKLIPQHGLALVYLDMGNTAKAVELFKLTYKIEKERNGVDHAGSCRSLSCLATAYSHYGDFELACETFEQALKMQQQLFPDGHPNIGITLHHMGSNFWRMKNYDRAIECYQSSLCMLERFMEIDHIEIALVKQKLQQLECELRNRLKVT